MDTEKYTKVIYVAGRYRDDRGEYYIRMNIREAERVALLIWGMGGIALCPHKNTAGYGGAFGLPDDVWLKGDLELLRRCDALMTVTGWEESNGAVEEIKFAKSLGKPILHSLADLNMFLSN